MYLFDTDTLTNLFDERRTQLILKARVEKEPVENLFVCMPTFEEKVSGWLALIHRVRKHPRKGAKIVEYYTLFQAEIEDVLRYRLLPYDEAAEIAYNTIPVELRRQHPLDCYIAAVGLARNLTVVTSNLRHFQKIPGLKCVDWTLAEDASD